MSKFSREYFTGGEVEKKSFFSRLFSKSDNSSYTLREGKPRYKYASLVMYPYTIIERPWYRRTTIYFLF